MAEPKEPTGPGEIVVRAAHLSMQFSDNERQIRDDAHDLFEREDERKVRWVTGTEAGKLETAQTLRRAADRFGFSFYRPTKQSVWVAIAERAIDDFVEVFFHQVVDGVSGRYTNRGPIGVVFEDTRLGPTTVLAAHYLTGRDLSLEENDAIADAIGYEARRRGRGRGLVFYGGDQNIPDRTEDTFFGNPLTSLWDELGKYEDTGHGNIDVLASYNRDGRVRGRSVNAVPDSEFRLHTDHFLVEGSWTVKVGKG